MAGALSGEEEERTRELEEEMVVERMVGNRKGDE